MIQAMQAVVVGSAHLIFDSVQVCGILLACGVLKIFWGKVWLLHIFACTYQMPLSVCSWIVLWNLQKFGST